jgi:hypothetical protein
MGLNFPIGTWLVLDLTNSFLFFSLFRSIRRSRHSRRFGLVRQRVLFLSVQCDIIEQQKKTCDRKITRSLQVVRVVSRWTTIDLVAAGEIG